MLLCMASAEVSLDDLLNGVEGLMTNKDLATSSMGDMGRDCQPTAHDASNWKQPPTFRKSPPRPSATTGSTAFACGDSVLDGAGEALRGMMPREGCEPINNSGCVDDVDELLRVVSVVEGGSMAMDQTPERTIKAVPSDESGARSGFERKYGNNGELAIPKRRCGRVFLAGADAPRGYAASSISQRACDNLRCTDCNFKVMCFSGKAWDVATDYIFLRNNAPDLDKLCARLQPSSDVCAYACQCSWQNVVELNSLSPTGRPPWTCGGH